MTAQLPDTQLSAGSASTQLYAMVNAAGRVIGLVEWDGSSAFSRETFRLVVAQGAQIGWSYGGGIFNEPIGKDTDVPE